MAARKKTASKKPKRSELRCGAIEAPNLDRGWVCCACYRKHGIGIYNGPDRKACKECGHKRCVGAMKRKWLGREVAVPSEMVGGLVGALMRAIGAFVPAAQVRRRTEQISPSNPTEDPKWQKACDEVVAAFAAAQLRAQQAGRETKGPPIDMLAKSVRARVPRAAEIFGAHPHDAPPCKCRHYSLIAAGAEQVAELTGADFDLLAKSGMRVVDWYLATRS
jgi:hypothetical protein